MGPHPRGPGVLEGYWYEVVALSFFISLLGPGQLFFALTEIEEADVVVYLLRFVFYEAPVVDAVEDIIKGTYFEFDNQVSGIDFLRLASMLEPDFDKNVRAFSR